MSGLGRRAGLCWLIALIVGVGWAGLAPVASADAGPCSLSTSLDLYSHPSTSGNNALIDSSTPVLSSGQYYHHVRSAWVPSGDAPAGPPIGGPCTSTWALYENTNYTGTCWDFAFGDLIPDFNQTYFRGELAASAAQWSRCGGQVLLYENKNFNLSTPKGGCSGPLSCFGYLFSGTNCPDNTTTCGTPKYSGKMVGLSISDATSGPVNGSVVTSGVLDSHAINFGVTALMLPSGGIAAVYDQPGFHGHCMSVYQGVASLGGLSGPSTTGDLGSFGAPSIADLAQPQPFYNTPYPIANDSIQSALVGRGCYPEVYLFSGPLADGNLLAATTHDTPGFQGYFGTAGQAGSLTNGGLGQSVSAFSGPNYTGDCTTLNANSDVTPELLHDTSVSSVRVGSTCSDRGSLYLYRSTDWSGTPLVLSTSTPDLRTVNFNDAAAAIVNSSGQTVSVYSDVGYGGICVNIPADSAQSSIPEAGTVSSVKFAPCPALSVAFFGTSPASADSAPITNVANLNSIVPAGEHLFEIANRTSDTISIYNGANYTGACEDVPPADVLLTHFNPKPVPGSNQVPAYIEPVSVRDSRCPTSVELFRRTSLHGAPTVLTRSTSDLGSFDRVAVSLASTAHQDVAVYSLPGYKGRCQTITPGETLSTLAGSEIGARQISSVRIGRPCKPIVLLFAGPSFRGVYQGVGADNPDLSSSVGHERSIANNAAHTISIYRGTGFTGACQNIPAGTSIPTLKGSVVHAGEIRSVKLSGPCPVAVELFSGASFTGRIFNAPSLSRNLSPEGWSRRAVSLVNNSGVPVAVYSLIRYKGVCDVFDAGAAIPDLGTFPYLGRDKIVSIQPASAAGDGCQSGIGTDIVIIPLTW